MSEYIRVKNWDKFQHYKDRTPPWIKLYNDLLSDYDFTCLQDDSKLHLVMIYLVASQTENRIPNDGNWIKKKAMLDNDVRLQPLIDAGFIELVQSDSETIADRKQDAIPEERREEERREEKEGEEEAARGEPAEADSPPESNAVIYEGANFAITAIDLEQHKLQFPRFRKFTREEQLVAYQQADAKATIKLEEQPNYNPKNTLFYYLKNFNASDLGKEATEIGKENKPTRADGWFRLKDYRGALVYKPECEYGCERRGSESSDIYYRGAPDFPPAVIAFCDYCDTIEHLNTSKIYEQFLDPPRDEMIPVAAMEMQRALKPELFEEEEEELEEAAA